MPSCFDACRRGLFVPAATPGPGPLPQAACRSGAKALRAQPPQRSGDERSDVSLVIHCASSSQECHVVGQSPCPVWPVAPRQPPRSLRAVWRSDAAGRSVVCDLWSVVCGRCSVVCVILQAVQCSIVYLMLQMSVVRGHSDVSVAAAWLVVILWSMVLACLTFSSIAWSPSHDSPVG